MNKKYNDNDIKILFGKKIRRLRNLKKITQQELGDMADINYKFLGEIERGQQNPSFQILIKIADALDVDLSEFFNFESEVTDRDKIESQIKHIIKNIPTENLHQILMILRIFYPFK